MSPEMDKIDEYDESIVSKPNRRRKLEQKTHATIVGQQPPTGMHKLARKESDRLRKKRLEEFITASPKPRASSKVGSVSV